MKNKSNEKFIIARRARQTLNYIVKNTEKFPIKYSALKKNINYIVVDNDVLIDKDINDKNNYNNYEYDKELLTYQSIRIDHIMKYLDNNRMNDNIREKINKIEKVLDI